MTTNSAIRYIKAPTPISVHTEYRNIVNGPLLNRLPTLSLNDADRADNRCLSLVISGLLDLFDDVGRVNVGSDIYTPHLSGEPPANDGLGVVV